ncbi:MAG: transcription antitermination factor NusB, partial [Chrysiogenetes bacterium]|nr:transcription antitermination factor NusB [Chrysiogenetes bacterium]
DLSNWEKQGDIRELLTQVHRGEPLGPVSEAYAATLVEGVSASRAEIDAALSSAAEKWDISRMADVDRNLLRLSTWELMFESETPVGVIINEAVTLAKRFGDKDTPSFVNGILDRVAREVRAAKDAADAK